MFLPGSPSLTALRGSGRFGALMDLYEQNYILMRLLAPGLRGFGEEVRASGDGHDQPSVRIGGLAQDRHTTSFRMGYVDSRAEAQGREPDFSIRLYHDAQVCEVMFGLCSDGSAKPRRMRKLDEEQRLNGWLNAWLRHLLERGYRFERTEACGDDEGGQRQKRSMLSW